MNNKRFWPVALCSATLLACHERGDASVSVDAVVIDGTLALNAHRAADAVDRFEYAERLDPSHARAQRGLGIASAMGGNGDLAVLHYKRYLALAPNAPDAALVKRIISDYESLE